MDHLLSIYIYIYMYIYILCTQWHDNLRLAVNEADDKQAGGEERGRYLFWPRLRDCTAAWTAFSLA